MQLFLIFTFLFGPQKYTNVGGQHLIDHLQEPGLDRVELGWNHVFLTQRFLFANHKQTLTKIGVFQVRAHFVHVGKVAGRDAVLPLNKQQIRSLCFWFLNKFTPICLLQIQFNILPPTSKKGERKKETCSCSKILSNFWISSFFFFSLPTIEGICLRSSAMMYAWTLARRARLIRSFSFRSAAFRGSDCKSANRSCYKYK